MRYPWPEGKESAVVLSFDFDAESGFLFREPEKAKRSLAGSSLGEPELGESAAGRRRPPRTGAWAGWSPRGPSRPEG